MEYINIKKGYTKEDVDKVAEILRAGRCRDYSD